jgi:hypothetical protein
MSLNGQKLISDIATKMAALLTKHQRHDWTLVYDRTGEWKECETESQPVRKSQQPSASDARSQSSLHGAQHKKKDLDPKVASEAKRYGNWTLVYDRTQELKEYEVPSQPDRKTNQPSSSDVRSQSSLHGTQHKKKDLDHKVASEAKRYGNWTLVYDRTQEWKEYEVPSEPDRKTNQPSASHVRSQSAYHRTPVSRQEKKGDQIVTIEPKMMLDVEDNSAVSQPSNKSF